MHPRAAFVAAALAASLAATRAEAQQSAPPPSQLTQSYQTWTGLSLPADIGKRAILWLDLQGRFYQDFHPANVQIRPGVGVKLKGYEWIAWAGYVWTPTWNGQRTFVDEHRVWQQLTYDGKPGTNLRLFVRTRFEQRMRPEIASDVALRLRQMTRLFIPFKQGFPLRTSIWDEVFIGLTDSANSPAADGTVTFWQKAGFDQNRLFAGIGWDFKPGSWIDVGYLNQWIAKPAGGSDVRHVFFINAQYWHR